MHLSRPFPRRPRAAFAPRALAPWLLLVAPLATTSCGDDKTATITDVRERSTSEPRPPSGMTAAQRFGRPEVPGSQPQAGMPTWTWTAPAGWTELPPQPMREVGFRVGGDPEAECTLVVLPASGGGLGANVDRWRKQMGLEPAGDAAIAALPKKPFLGREAAFVDLAGRYKGMRGDKDLGDARMIGLIASLPAASVFVKMVGPAKTVEAETPRFFEFAASVRSSFGAPHGGDVGDAAPSAPSPHGGATIPDLTLTWKAPPGWSLGPEKPMRLATLLVAAAPKIDVSVARYGGTAGGTLANVNRWRGQLGLDPIGESEVGKLERLKVLGTDAVLVEIKGKYTDMQGVTTDDATLLGLVVERPDGTVFVKMTGPSADVAAERARFVEFCKSLEESK